MYIESFRVFDFASFEDSGLIELDSKMNLFIGVNNSGKSSLLQSLINPLDANRHKSADNSHQFAAARTTVEIDLHIEIEDLLRRLALAKITPAGTSGSTSAGRPGIDRYIEFLNSSESVTLSGARSPNNPLTAHTAGSIKEYQARTQQQRVSLAGEAGDLRTLGSSQKDTLLDFFDRQAGSIFYFGPQRLNVGTYQYGLETSLASDASNLPAVLFYISANFPAKFVEIETHLRDIMPGVGKIRVAPSQNGYMIRVFPDEDASTSISFSLEKSGTGIGQLLAILTAVVIHDQSIIVIDEISTFLHSTASKKLISLLQTEYDQHQYIISTHSAEVIFSSICPRVFKVWREGLDSEVARIELSTTKDAKDIANYLGFSMLDVFGNERMIWVEGPTEVLCFPLILRAYGRDLGAEFGFAPVQVPSLFSDRKSKHKQVELIYSAAGKSLAPLLKGMAFGLDRESMSDDAVISAERSKRKVRFLNRRCYENYLLHADIITQYLRQLGEDCTEELVQDCLIRLADENGYSASSKWRNDLSNEVWLKHVDGARLISDAFATLTENRWEYVKTRDSTALTTLILDNDKERLSEAFEFVELLVKTASKNTAP